MPQTMASLTLTTIIIALAPKVLEQLSWQFTSEMHGVSFIANTDIKVRHKTGTLGIPMEHLSEVTNLCAFH